MNIKSLVFVTSAQPSANPRMLKEAICLSDMGFEVTVIWSPITPWADFYDKELFTKYKSIKWVQAGYHHNEKKLKYNLSRLRKKIWYCIYRFCGNRFDAGVKSMVMFSQELTREALKKRADIFIGHNLGSISSIVKAAYKFNAKTIFDFEDFYRGELDERVIASEIIRSVEYKYVPKVKYFTAASYEIANAYRHLFQGINIKTILNVFPIDYAPSVLVRLPPQPLKLFWFSQFVGKNRGLETVIKAMGILKKFDIRLTLLGNITAEMKDYFINVLEENEVDKNRLLFIDSVRENELVRIASEHHIGIASEVSHNLNRQYCLTNKIFIYLLAGNAIVFSNTEAQKKFLDENNDIGCIYSQENQDELSNILYNYICDNIQLNKHRQNSLSASQKKYNWDLEKTKYMSIISNIHQS